MEGLLVEEFTLGAYCCGAVEETTFHKDGRVNIFDLNFSHLTPLLHTNNSSLVHDYTQVTFRQNSLNSFRTPVNIGSSLVLFQITPVNLTTTIANQYFIRTTTEATESCNFVALVSVDYQAIPSQLD